MKVTRRVRPLAWLAPGAVCLGLACSLGLSAKESLPQVSPEGLQLQPLPQVRAFYKKPGATFSQYKRVAIVDCYVEFAKDWERNYNDSQVGFDGRVSADDMDRMKKAIAAEFKKVFTLELQTKGHYQVVDVAAPDVLALRPALINVMVTAPDLMSADMGRTIISSAGQMTLYLELWDSATNTLLARAIDPEADPGMGGMGESADRVTNMLAADTILRHWADLLRKHLDAVQGTTASH